uniref:Ig-like domain-containing protein n=1 Tax=Stegastes partitus TaxID=144197 RepID=A0A3B4ZF66_9TELE
NSWKVQRKLSLRICFVFSSPVNDLVCLSSLHSPPVEPSFLQISSIPQIPEVERLLVLCCRVENFYPQDVYLEWSRNDGEEVRMVTHFGPFSDRSSCLFSVWSKIHLVLAREDEKAVYSCRVYHCSFPTWR